MKKKEIVYCDLSYALTSPGRGCCLLSIVRAHSRFDLAVSFFVCKAARLPPPFSLSPHPAFFLYTKAHTSASCEHWRRLTTKAGRMMLLKLAFIFKWSSLASKRNWRKWTSKYSRNRLRDFAHFVTVANIKRSSDFQLSWKLLVTKRQTRL
jgi:hypothetical protein